MKKPAGDFISLTAIARFKNYDHYDDLIRNWLPSRSSVEFLGIWERINNPGFNSLEFDGIRIHTGLNSFVLTPKQWIKKLKQSASSRMQDATAQPKHTKTAPSSSAHGSAPNSSSMSSKECQRLGNEENHRLISHDWLSLFRTFWNHCNFSP